MNNITRQVNIDYSLHALSHLLRRIPVATCFIIKKMLEWYNKTKRISRRCFRQSSRHHNFSKLQGIKSKFKNKKKRVPLFVIFRCCFFQIDKTPRNMNEDNINGGCV